MIDFIGYPGFLKFIGKNFTFCINEFSTSILKSSFLKKTQKLIPDIRSKDIKNGPAGVRAQGIDSSGNLMMDFESGSIISGSRFVVLKSDLALLERALINFMIELHVNDHGYVEISAPHLVRSESLVGTGQLPKFEKDLFKVNSDKWLIPTAEVTLTNLYRKKIFKEKELPLRLVSFSNCFRSEAGAAGIDTKPM